jgi:hypothetical protein
MSARQAVWQHSRMTEINWICLVLFGMNNMIPDPILQSLHRIFHFSNGASRRSQTHHGKGHQELPTLTLGFGTLQMLGNPDTLTPFTLTLPRPQPNLHRTYNCTFQPSILRALKKGAINRIYLVLFST